MGAHRLHLRFATLLAIAVTAGCYDLVPDAKEFGAPEDALADGEQADTATSDTATSLDAHADTGTAVDGGPDAAKPDATKPDTTKPDTTGPDTTSPDTTSTDTTKTDTTNPDATSTDATNADTANSDTGSPDAGPSDPCAAKPDKTPCDDGDPCTTAACQGGKCTKDADLCECKVSADCKAKEDGNLCTGTLYCNTVIVPHKCQTNPATVTACKTSGNVCATTSCDEKTGKCATKQVKDTFPPKTCDDGNPCTKADSCLKGVCEAGVNTCLCTKHADCEAKEDGDACNGTLFCDTSLPKPQCVLNPATVVSCPDQSGACVSNTCDKKTGKCVAKKAADAAPCSDGNPCTKSDTCASGVCKPGVDTCQCKTTADCAQFDDGDVCNGVDYCDVQTGTCKTNPKTVITCAKGTECAPIRCDKPTGQCVADNKAKFATCNADNNPCTVDDTCDGKGGCIAGTDVCVCSQNADCAKHEDGNACNGTLYCDKLANPPTCKVNPKTVVTCKKPASSCEIAACDPTNGACSTAKKSDFSACDDGNKCTIGDVCEKGKCTAGPDLCACKADADCLDDGDLCNGTLYCDKTAKPASCKLKPNTVVSCDPKLNSGCIEATCDAKSGKCSAASNDGKCDDKDPCTVDVCGGNGQCSNNPGIDGIACTSAKKAGFCVTGKCTAAPKGMVFVPAGELPMGCNKALDPGCSADEKPQHKLTLKGFWIDRFEATAGDYKACIDAGNCKAPSGSGKTCNHGVKARLSHPINCIDHAAAAAFCAHLGKRLPTEAEWEIAARGGCKAWPTDCEKSQPRFPWGLSVATCTYTVMKSDAGDGCGVGTTRGIGTYTKDSSALGIRDLGGNVAEWTNDWYDAGYYAKSPAADPPGPVTATMRVVRGGHFASDASDVRAGNRHPTAPTAALPTIGVRCAQDVKP